MDRNYILENLHSFKEWTPAVARLKSARYSVILGKSRNKGPFHHLRLRQCKIRWLRGAEWWLRFEGSKQNIKNGLDSQNRSGLFFALHQVFKKKKRTSNSYASMTQASDSPNNATLHDDYGAKNSNCLLREFYQLRGLVRNVTLYMLKQHSNFLVLIIVHEKLHVTVSPIQVQLLSNHFASTMFDIYFYYPTLGQCTYSWYCHPRQHNSCCVHFSWWSSFCFITVRFSNIVVF